MGSLDNIEEIINRLPKTEIHLHLEGLVSVDSIWRLIQRHHLNVGVSTREDLRQRFAIKNLAEFIDLFINIVQACFLSIDDLDLMFEDAEHYLQHNNIKYAEVFFAPTRLLKNGIQFPNLVHKLHEGSLRLEENGIKVLFIVDVSRGFGIENAQRNLELTLKYRTDRIIGLGLGGAEKSGPARDFVSVFERAIDNGLKVVAHAGEDAGPASIWEAIDLLHVQRIGHGTSAFLDQKLMDTIRERNIPLEICPTSNLQTARYATTLHDHPIRRFFDEGLCVTINTDDPTLFGTGLTTEYVRLLEAEIFSIEEIRQIIRNGISATFLPHEEKTALLNAL